MLSAICQYNSLIVTIFSLEFLFLMVIFAHPGGVTSPIAPQDSDGIGSSIVEQP